MNTQTLSILFPDLKNQGSKKIDLRCSLSEDELKKGNIKSDISTLRFIKGDQVNLDLYFGCSILINNEDGDETENEQAKQVK